MKRIKDRHIILISIIVLILLSIFFIDFSFVEISNLTVFISIITGYQITSVSILYNSRILHILHKERDREYLNLLNRVAFYYKNTIFSGIIFVLYLIFIPEFKINFKYFIINNSSFYVAFSFYILYYFVKVNLIFFKIFVIPRNE